MAKEKRRVHSKIDKLPPWLVKAIRQMMVDNIWPEDFIGEKIGKPRYVDMMAYTAQKGHKVSLHVIGRYCRRLRSLAMMKEKGVLVRSIMKNVGDANVSESQKAAAELVTALILERVVQGEDLNTKEIKQLAEAAYDCSRVAITADKYIRERTKEKVERANKNISQIARKKQIDPETLKAIKEQVYGIIDRHLDIERP